MFYPPELLKWVEQVSTHFPHLSQSQAQILAWYSFAVTVVQSCGMSHVSYFLGCLLSQPENTLRQRLRESLYNAGDKRGKHRRETEVMLCFAPLLKWVLSLWKSEDGVLFVALDATTLRQTFTVLSVSVLVGRCAIPIAWAILPATVAGKWKPHWQKLLASVSIPDDGVQVMVLTDRGLYARWLFEAILANGWHPLMRINAHGSVCLHETGQRLNLTQLAALARGKWWRGQVTCFSAKRQLRATLLVLWDDSQQEVWLLLTDLSPNSVSPTWYLLRMWIESGFKFLKSAAFHWERTRMTDPARAERLWLVLALATLRLATLSPNSTQLPEPAFQHYPRLNLFKQALLRQLAFLILHQPLSFYPLHMHPLPASPCLDFIALLNTYP